MRGEVLVALVVLAGCNRGPAKPETLVYAEGRQIKNREFKELPPGAHARNLTLDGRIRLLGVMVEPQRLDGPGTVTLTTWWLLEKELLEDWRLFVHGTGVGGEMNLVQADHEALGGLMPTSRWRTGEVLEDVVQLRMPDPSPVGQMQLWGGFYRGQLRMSVDDKTQQDGQNRVLLATVNLGDGKALPEYTAPKRQGPITVDGNGTEPDWEKAPKAGPFFNYDGRGIPGNKTTARLLWDEQALYVLFDCEDKDIWTSFTQRDDHIYDEEAVEIFLDADADLGTHPDPQQGDYVELQAAPNDVHFDAAFTGRRKNMNPSYNSSYETKAVLRGTFNNPADVDEGWTSEWRIPWADIPDAKEIKQGKHLRFNLFRLDKVRQNGRVVENQASAWSTPLSGDFHNVARFGWLTLGP